MTTVISHKFTFITLIFLVIIFADQTTKYLASKYVSTFVCNEGISFGLPLASPLILFLILIVISFFALREKNCLAMFALSLILGGGISNLADRLAYDCVRDFIAIGIFPSFNLADAMISIGVAMIFLNLLKKRFSKNPQVST